MKLLKRIVAALGIFGTVIGLVPFLSGESNATKLWYKIRGPREVTISEQKVVWMLDVWKDVIGSTTIFKREGDQFIRQNLVVDSALRRAIGKNYGKWRPIKFYMDSEHFYYEGWDVPRQYVTFTADHNQIYEAGSPERKGAMGWRDSAYIWDRESNVLRKR